MSREDILHTLIDVAAGRRNLPPHQADELHEELTPGYTAVAPSDDAVAEAVKVLEAHRAAEAAKNPAPAEAPADVAV